WTSVTGTLALPPVLLYLGGGLSMVGYNTIYAHQDKEDDIRIGVKSSAIALGSHTRPWLAAFYGAALLLWAAAGVAAGLGVLFWVGLAATALQLAWQAARVATDDPADCLAKFRSNRAVGWLMLAGIVAGHFVCPGRFGPHPLRTPQHRHYGAAAGTRNQSPPRHRDHADLASDRGKPRPQRVAAAVLGL